MQQKGERIMKKVGILIMFFVLMSAFTDAQAEVKAGSVSLTPLAGVRFFEGSQDLRTSAVFGLRAGYNFTENLGLEGFFTYTKTEIESDADWKPWQEILGYGIEGLYHFMPHGRFVPFIAIGIGGTYYGKGEHYSVDPSYGERFESNKLTVDYGAGAKYFLTENIALRADVRHVIPLNSKWNNPDYFHNDFLATLGINLSFGGRKKVVSEVKSEEPTAPIVDSDKDGVPDYLDKCPGTPASVVVDKDGCPPDSDKDGVPDYLDKCPGTPAGVAVDKDGCAPDHSQNPDKAGVPGHLDKYPEPTAGVPVDKDGSLAETKKISILLKLEFDTNKAVIQKKYYKELKRVAAFMKAHPQATATIVGHTDDVEKSGKPKSSMLLSKARANSVRQYLIKKFGIKGSRITALGYGPDKPIASNKTKEGRQKNRRVVALFETVQER
jgi:OOP family OmpA-OmpF porin